MKYLDRQDLEKIGSTGVQHYKLPNNTIATRILSSYWLALKNGNDDFVPHLKKDGYWESWISLWVSQNVAPGSICIDGGANYGYYTFQLLLHGCKVFAIEANPNLIPYLKTSLSLNGNLPLTIINSAITDGSTESVTLNIAKSPLHSSIFFEKNVTDKIEVTTTRLKDFDKYDIDFIKLDIEGNENQALPDLIELQKKNPNLLCLMEWVYDTYPNKSKDLYEYIVDNFLVSYVDYDGTEVKVTSYDFIKNETIDLRMYVLRSKSFKPNIVTDTTRVTARDDSSFFFIHVYKNMGTTLYNQFLTDYNKRFYGQKTLTNWEVINNEEIKATKKHVGRTSIDHIRIDELVRLGILDDKDIEHRKFIGLVREPISRFISMCNFKGLTPTQLIEEKGSKISKLTQCDALRTTYPIDLTLILMEEKQLIIDWFKEHDVDINLDIVKNQSKKIITKLTDKELAQVKEIFEDDFKLYDELKSSSGIKKLKGFS
jgi:FkbM family methyltransferase